MKAFKLQMLFKTLKTKNNMLSGHY